MGSKDVNNTRNVQNLNISLINNENVQIGCNNTLVVVRGNEDDIPENNNNIPHISEVTLLSGDKKSLKYRSSGPTCISIGNNCTIAELVLNKELLDELRTGKFTVTKGDNLLSIIWYDDNLYQSEQGAADHKAIKIRFSEDQDIQKLEKQVFELIADYKDKKLVQLITEFLNSYKARLKHINMGCIELEIDLQSDSSLSFLDKKEEIKDLLRRTIIPEGALFDIELQSPSPSANEGQSTSENFQHQNKNDLTTDEKDLAPESNKDDCSLLEAGASSSSLGYKIPEDKGTVDVMESSSSLLSTRYKIPEDKERVDMMEPSSSLLSTRYKIPEDKKTFRKVKPSSSLLSARYKIPEDKKTFRKVKPSSSLLSARYKTPEDKDTVDLMEPSSSLLSARHKIPEDKDTVGLMEPRPSLLSARYKLLEDKDTVDLMEPSSSLSSSETESLVPYNETLDKFKHCMLESFAEISERCKTVIKLELIRHLTSQEKIPTRLDESKNKINIKNILQKLDTEFERFYIDLNKIIQLGVEGEYTGCSLSRYEDLVTTGKTVSKVRRSVRSKHTTLERTTSMETLTGEHEPESSDDITDIIINKIEEQIYMTTDRCRKKIRFIIEKEGKKIPKWENKEDKPEPITSPMEFGNLLAKYNIKSDWLMIQHHIDLNVNWLKTRIDIFEGRRLGLAAFDTQSGEESSTSRLYLTERGLKRKKKHRSSTTSTFDSDWFSDMLSTRKKYIREIEKEETQGSSTMLNSDLLLKKQNTIREIKKEKTEESPTTSTTDLYST